GLLLDPGTARHVPPPRCDPPRGPGRRAPHAAPGRRGARGHPARPAAARGLPPRPRRREELMNTPSPSDVGRLVHLGIGNFARAHTLHATEVAGGWSVVAFTGRSATMADALNAQGDRYGLIVRGAEGDEVSLVDVIDEVHPASDVDALVRLLADPFTAVVTLTITLHATEVAGGWSVVAFTGRSATMADALNAQGDRYGLIVRGAEGDEVSLVDVIDEVHPASDVDALVRLLADPFTAVVTLTITEK